MSLKKPATGVEVAIGREHAQRSAK